METENTRKSRLTVAEIAEHAGVSTATVDRVIHNRPGVKPHTVTHINSVIEALESGSSRGMKSNRFRDRYNFEVILPEGPNSFFNTLEEELRSASENDNDGVTFSVRRIEGFNPRVLADSVRRFAEASDGLALVAIEDPLVRDAVNQVADAGVPVVTLVSNLLNARHHAYVGLDNRAAGRTAGYLMSRFAPDQGSVLLIAGSMSLRDHEEREIGFRRVLGERSGNLHIIARLEDHDDYRTTYKEAKRTLEDHPDLVGIYNIGAGNRGIANAMEESKREHDIVFIGHELTHYSRQYLIDDVMDAVIDQNPKAEVQQLKKMLTGLRQNGPHSTGSVRREVRVFFRENLP